MARKKKGGGGGHGGGGHDSAGGLRWLLTYADMITLLMAFFIMLYSISVLDVQKFKQMTSSFREVFGMGREKFNTSGTSMLESGQLGNVNVSGKAVVGSTPPELTNIEESIEKYLERLKLSGQIWVHSDERGSVISIFNEDFLFAAGSAEIKGKGQNVLQDIAKLIITLPNPIRLEGHTSNVPVSNVFFPSNWELSASRAGAVARFLMEVGGIDVKRMSVAGYGEHRPLVSNSNDANRRINNRTDIVILKSLEQKKEAR
jgi:chemotaxis protein MotB